MVLYRTTTSRTTASEEVEIDLSDDVKALVSSDADLSEEFKDKAATIFETAVKTRIKEQTKYLKHSLKKNLHLKLKQ